MRSIKGFYNKIVSNKDRKVLVENFGYLTILQFAGYIFPLITIPYLARTIGTVGFGKLYFASAVITWFMSVITWGLDYTATRDVSRIRSDRKEVSRIFSNVIWSRALLLVFCLLLLLVLIGIIPKFREYSAVLFVTFLMLPGHILFPEWLFQALEKMKYITILSLLSKVLFTVLVFLFITQESDYLLQPLFTSLGYLISGIIAIYIIIKRWGIDLYKPNKEGIIQTLKGSFDVFLNNVLPNLYNSMSSVLVGIFSGDVANGILSAATKWITVSHQVFLSLSRAFFPFLARRLDKHTVYAKINIWSSLAISLLLFIFAPVIIHIFYTEDFYSAIPILRILSWSIFFMALSNSYGTNYLILIGKERVLRRITMILSVLGLAMAVPLIYYFSYLGAAITIVTTRALIGITISYFASLEKKRLQSID